MVASIQSAQFLDKNTLTYSMILTTPKKEGEEKIYRFRVLKLRRKEIQKY